jgi:dipeptidyl aminopeptidase/acylaminoacyl peptidase
LRENELQDLRDAVAWLRRRPQLDGTRVAIMGGSCGGYLTRAALALARLPEVFASGVAFVGVSNWITALRDASPQLKASDRIEYGDIDDPADREFFKVISPITHAAQVRAPVTVMHGANDPRDPVTESDQVVRAIRDSRMVEIDDSSVVRIGRIQRKLNTTGKPLVRPRGSERLAACQDHQRCWLDRVHVREG